MAGTQRTINVTNTPTIQYVIFKDIAISGPGVPYTTTRTGDAGNNSGMTLSPARTLYWVNNGATSYASTSTWSLSSGGASGQDPPMPQDTIVIDANSITSTGKTMNVAWQGIPTLDFTNVANSPIVNFQNTNGYTIFFGDVILNSSMTSTSGGGMIFMNSNTTQHLDAKGISLGSAIAGVDKPNSTLQLLSDYVSTNTSSLTLNSSMSSTAIGTFDANGHNVTTVAVNSSSSATRTIDMSSGTWTLTGTGTVWQFSTMTNLTLNAGTSTIAITDNSSSTKTIAHGSAMTLANLTVTGGGTGAIIFGANALTLNNLTVSSSPTTLTFTSGAGSTTTIGGSFTATGSPGNLITINASTGGSQAILSKSSGKVSCNYLSLQDSKATGGAAWYAGANSTNISDNTGWAFYGPPGGYGNLMMLLQ